MNEIGKLQYRTMHFLAAVENTGTTAVQLAGIGSPIRCGPAFWDTYFGLTHMLSDFHSIGAISRK